MMPLVIGFPYVADRFGGSNASSLVLARALQDHVKAMLAPFKYPRWIEFRADLPKTATGKIQRFRLRAEAPGG